MDEQLPQVMFDMLQAFMMVVGSFLLVRGGMAGAAAEPCGRGPCLLRVPAALPPPLPPHHGGPRILFKGNCMPATCP